MLRSHGPVALFFVGPHGNVGDSVAIKIAQRGDAYTEGLKTIIIGGTMCDGLADNFVGRHQQDANRVPLVIPHCVVVNPVSIQIPKTRNGSTNPVGRVVSFEVDRVADTHEQRLGIDRYLIVFDFAVIGYSGGKTSGIIRTQPKSRIGGAGKSRWQLRKRQCSKRLSGIENVGRSPFALVKDSVEVCVQPTVKCGFPTRFIRNLGTQMTGRQ